jgi:hypothetical protein
MKEIEKKESTTKKIQKMKNVGRKGLGFNSKNSEEKDKQIREKKLDEKIKQKILKKKENNPENKNEGENNFIQNFNSSEILSKFTNLKRKKIKKN